MIYLIHLAGAPQQGVQQCTRCGADLAAWLEEAGGVLVGRGPRSKWYVIGAAVTTDEDGAVYSFPQPGARECSRQAANRRPLITL
jgi:hypothetical protein